MRELPTEKVITMVEYESIIFRWKPKSSLPVVIGDIGIIGGST
jgi:hypothetical protein